MLSYTTYEYFLGGLHMKRWWCMNCDREVRLGKHGQCEDCGSEAVDMLSVDGELNALHSMADEDSEAAQARR
jgi:hypothetical protein